MPDAKVECSVEAASTPRFLTVLGASCGASVGHLVRVGKAHLAPAFLVGTGWLLAQR